MIVITLILLFIGFKKSQGPLYFVTALLAVTVFGLGGALIKSTGQPANIGQVLVIYAAVAILARSGYRGRASKASEETTND